jgi:hypothetical protein
MYRPLTSTLQGGYLNFIACFTYNMNIIWKKKNKNKKNQNFPENKKGHAQHHKNVVIILAA